MKGRDGASESDLHERTGRGDRIRPIESVTCQKEAMEGRDVVTESNLEAQEEKRREEDVPVEKGYHGYG